MLRSSVAPAQADWPLPYWPGVVVAHSIYAIFEARRWSNFQKYKEVCSSSETIPLVAAGRQCGVSMLQPRLLYPCPQLQSLYIDSTPAKASTPELSDEGRSYNWSESSTHVQGYNEGS